MHAAPIMEVRRAKIVCTIGPAVDSRDKLRRLIEAGMDVARLNFSHGVVEDHRERARLIREESQALGKPIAILQDLCGPKIRTGFEGMDFAEPGAIVNLIEGSSSAKDSIAIDYHGLTQDVREGDRILLGDGHVELEVVNIREFRVEARVLHGGALRSRMGVNLPSKRVRLSALTDKDRRDLEAGLDMGVDLVALSFVRTADDIRELQELMQSHGRVAPIVAKVETPGAVEQLDAIVRAADAVMVARGDLGVELPPEMVPVVQKEIIGTCRRYQRPVIVATEMLQSMVDAPRPTRAEASDVAGAIFDGADAVMLSAETATGKHPFSACAIMDRIIREAESSRFYQPLRSEPGDSTPEAIADAACDVAKIIRASILVALTESGGTARLVSKARPPVPILALSPDEKTLRRLALFWGVIPRFLDMDCDVDQLVRRTNTLIRDQGFAMPGERFVMTYGAPIGVRGSTNAIRVEVVSR